MKQFTFLNTLKCFRISSSCSANSNVSKAVRSLYTATHAHFFADSAYILPAVYTYLVITKSNEVKGLAQRHPK